MTEEQQSVFLMGKYTDAKAIKEINKPGVSEVILSDRLITKNGISFLRQCPKVASLRTPFDLTEEDIETLYKLPALENLSLFKKISVEVDFTQMNKLKEILLYWSPQITSIFAVSSLKSMTVRDINTIKITDLKFMSKLKNLEKLSIERAKVQSLKGINSLSRLKDLTLLSLPKLTDVTELSEIKKLNRLWITRCNNIEGLEKVLAKLVNLNQLSLEDQSAIKSLKFLKKLKKLKVLSLDRSTLVDGDLTTIFDKSLSLESIYFKNRKHYSHTWDEIYDYLQGST